MTRKGRSQPKRRSRRTARQDQRRIDQLAPTSYEARKAAKLAARAFSLDWDENEALGMPDEQRRQGAGGTLTDYERKETLWQAYLNVPWISASIDTTAKRIVSGGYTIDPVTQGEGNQAHYDVLESLILRTDEDWDFLQFTESVALDLGIFGESYAEIVWDGNIPYALHHIDCLTMSYHSAKNGQITGYTQRMTHSAETVPFEPREIIRWWRPSPRAAMQALSFIEKLNNAVYSDQNMVNWVHRFFRNGARPDFWVSTDGDEEEARRLIAFFRENYTGVKNAHIPPVMYAGSQLHEFNKPPVDIDFEKGRKGTRDEILAVSGTPPAMVNVIESGNIGGGTGESQHKSFQYNTTDPLKRIIFEKFNYRITKQGFCIFDWLVGTKYADYRDDSQVAEVQDKRIRNGASTINEERGAMGRKPLPKGGNTAVIVTTKEITPVERLDEIADEQRQQAELTIEQAKAPPPAKAAPPADAAKPPESDDTAAKDDAKATNADDASKDDGSLAQPATAKKQAESRGDLLDELFAWEMRALEDARDGHRQCGFTTTIIPEALHAAISRRLEHCTDFGEMISIFTEARASLIAWRENDRVAAFEASSDRPTLLQQHTGMMLALLLDPETAQQLAIPGGEPPGDLHITLAFLGDMEDTSDDDLLRPHTSPFKMRDAIAMIAARTKPLAGKIAGFGRFDAPEGEPTPILALPDIPGLVEFRTKLVEVVEAAGYFVAADHGYTPHITLAYIDASAPLPITSVRPLPLSFETVWLCVGDDRIPFSLAKAAPPDDDGSLSQVVPFQEETVDENLSHASAPPSALFQPDAAAAAALREQHDAAAALADVAAEGHSTNDLQAPSVPMVANNSAAAIANDDGSLSEAAPNPGGDTGSQASAATPNSSFDTGGWQQSDPGVAKQIAEIRARGVTHLRWDGHNGACDECMRNDGVTVPVGSPFPTGALLPQQHPNCICGYTELQETEQGMHVVRKVKFGVL